MSLYTNLFTGPTKEQDAEHKRKEKIEYDYIAWVNKNRGASLQECEKYYKKLNKAV